MDGNDVYRVITNENTACFKRPSNANDLGMLWTTLAYQEILVRTEESQSEMCATTES